MKSLLMLAALAISLSLSSQASAMPVTRAFSSSASGTATLSGLARPVTGGAKLTAQGTGIAGMTSFEIFADSMLIGTVVGGGPTTFMSSALTTILKSAINPDGKLTLTYKVGGSPFSVGSGSVFGSVSYSTVPEPATISLLAIGAVATGLASRRRRQVLAV